MVRFIFAIETSRDRDKASMTGKKMKDDRGENVAAKDVKESIKSFCLLVKIEYDGEVGEEG